MVAKGYTISKNQICWLTNPLTTILELKLAQLQELVLQAILEIIFTHLLSHSVHLAESNRCQQELSTDPYAANGLTRANATMPRYR